MKTTAPLLLAVFGLLIASASAAQSYLEADVLILPTYVVHAPRDQPFEKQLKANLREACQNAHAPLAITRELSPPKIHTRVAELALYLPETKTRQRTKS